MNIYKQQLKNSHWLKKGLLATLFWVGFIPILTAQTFNNWTVETTHHLGRIIKHTNKIFFDIKGLTSATELNFSYQTYGKKEWQQFQRYPKMGIAIMYQDLGDASIFGEAWSFLPNINLVAHQGEKLKLGFRLGTGVGYLNKTYNVITNPTNNAIGSNWNASILFELNTKWQLSEHWQLKGGLSFIHYSNGANHLPNFGINIPSLVTGLRYTPHPSPPENYIHHDVSKKEVSHRWGAIAWAIHAFKERGIPGGPSYPVYNISLGTYYQINKVNRLIGGVGYEYNDSVYEFGKHVYAFDSESEGKWKSSRIQVFVADEFLFGNFGVMVLLGAYASNTFYLLPFPLYNQLTTRYYIPLGKRLKCHVGIYLKSHITIAEYMGLGAGFSF